MTTEEKARRYDLLMVQIRADIADCREMIAGFECSIKKDDYNGSTLRHYEIGIKEGLKYALNILNKLKELMNE